MRGVVGFVKVVSAVMMLTVCGANGAQRRAEFVRSFVQSAREDSDYFRRYVSNEDIDLIAIARPMMTGDFDIVHRDESSGDAYEYGIRFSNGATAIVALYEKQGEIRQATLAIDDRPRE